MNSFNHYAYGAVGDWMYRKNIAGIDQLPDSCGYEKLLIHPCPTEQLAWAKGRLKTVRGTVATEWKREDGQYTISVTVPEGPDALIVLPAQDAAGVTESGKPLSDNPTLIVTDPMTTPAISRFWLSRGITPSNRKSFSRTIAGLMRSI